MKWLTFKVQHEPGFRFNLCDLIILVVLVIISLVFYSVTTEGLLYLLPLYVGFTFFVFCNLFRIGNGLEAVWYVPFVPAVIYGSYNVEVLWPLIFSVFVPLTVVLVLYRIFKGPYMGVFYRHIGRGG